jgi:hypothetical protein
VVAKHGVSERLAYRVLWQHRYLQRNDPIRFHDEAGLAAEFTSLVTQCEAVETSPEWCDFRTNGHCKSFNAKLRDELRNGEIFYALKESKIVIDT